MSYPKIYLMRHGETQWNVACRMQGQLDSPLTEKGQAQAIKMGQILAREVPDPQNYQMFTSPLGRTVQTSELVAQNFAFAPQKDDLLMEVYAGSWGGKLRSDIKIEFPDLVINDRIPMMCNSSDGEKFEDLKARGQKWLDGLTGQAIVVSHGQIGLVIRGLYTGISDDEMFEKTGNQNGVYLLNQGQERFIT
ncbi:MAG: histidine phosphatase family protein [Alphaproteobacteria bacterium]|nr:histidine phosphatase family protein [Alphaproteobacteria bacterium]